MLLYVLEKDPFVQCVTGHAPTASAATSIITDHLRSQREAPGPDDPDQDDTG